MELESLEVASEPSDVQTAFKQPASTGPNVSEPTPRNRGSWVWLAISSAVIIICAIVVGTIYHAASNRNVKQGSQQAQVQQIDLTGLGSILPSTSNTEDKININGQLNANQGLVIKPANQPATSLAGQVYFDQTTGLLRYYNGQTYISLSSQTDLQTLQNRISSLPTAATGVTSLQGANGALALLGGSGLSVSVNGTNILLSLPQNLAQTASPTFTGLTLSSALSVASGGTGAANQQLAINNLSGLTTSGDLLYFDGTNTTRLALGASADCLTSNGTTLVWDSCASAGAGANKALSNLVGVAINTSLLPVSAGTINLGSTLLPFGQLSLAGAVSTDSVLSVRTAGDANDRLSVDASGKISFGLGSSPATTSLQYGTTIGGANTGLILNGNAFQLGSTGFFMTSNGTIATSSGQTLGLFGSSLISLRTKTVINASGEVGAANVPLTVKATALQSADLQEWTDSSGTPIAGVRSTGNIYAANYVNSSNPNNSVLSLNSSGALLYTAVASNVALKVQNQAGSPSGDLLQLLNSSGTVLSSFGVSGNLQVASTATAGTAEKLRVNTPTTVDNAASTILTSDSTSTKALVVQGLASRSVAVAEFQNSNGASILTVGNAGTSNVYALGDLQAGTGFDLTSTSASAGYFKKSALAGTGGVSVNDVVILANDSGNSRVTDTTTARDIRVYGVAYSTATSGNSTSVVISGNFQVNADTSVVAIGDQLVTSTTSGQVTVDNSATTGILGVATTAKGAGAGLVGVSVGAVRGQYGPVFRPGAATNIGVTIQGEASQSANLFDVLDSSNNELFRVGSNGGLAVANNANAIGGLTQVLGQQLTVYSGAGANIGLVVRPSSFVVSQTADLLQIQNSSGTPLAGISGAGVLFTGVSAALSNNQVGIVAGAATRTGLIVRGAVSQSADLLQLQDSSTNLLTRFDPTGYLHFDRVAVASDNILTVRVVGDTNDRFTIQGDGTQSFGPGNTASDVNIKRNGIGLLQVTGKLQVTNAAAYATQVAFRVNGAAGQSADLLQLTDSAGNVNSIFNSTGNQLTLGRIAGSGTVTQGKLLFSDGTTDNFGLTLQSSGAQTQSTTITIPNSGNATDTVCLLTLANCTGVAGPAFIQGGNTFGTDFVFGPTDAYGINFQTGNATKLTLGPAGNLTFNQSSTIGALQNTNPNAAGYNLSLSGGTASGFTTGNAGGNVAITGGAANGTGNNNGGNVTLSGGTRTGTGSSGSVIVKPSGTDNTAAFQVQNVAGTSFALTVDTTNNRVGVGIGTPQSALNVSTDQASAAWGSSGLGLRVNNATYLDTTSSGAVALAVGNSFTGPTLSASSPTTYAQAATLYINGGPSAGSNVTITSGLALDVSGRTLIQTPTNSTSAFQIQNNAGNSNLLVADTTNTRIGIGVTAPSDVLHVKEDLDGHARILFDNPNAGTSATTSVLVRNSSSDINAGINVGATGSGYTGSTVLGSNGGFVLSESSLTSGLTLGTMSNSAIKFVQGGTGSGNQVMTIQSGGDVGIGTGTATLGNLLTVGALTTPSSGQFAVSTGSTTGNGIIIQNVAGQSGGNILQAQASDGTTILAKIDYLGNLTVKAATINGHLITGNGTGTTTVVAGAAANCASSATGVSVSGNDTSGTVSFTTGSAACSAGTLATVTFANVYTGSSTNLRVILTPANPAASAVQYYNGTINTTSGNGSGFTIDTNTGAAAATPYKYHYWVVQ